MIRMSAADYSWPVLSHATVMSVVADLGFDGIDLGLFGDTSHVTVTEVVQDPAGTAERVARLARSRGLEVADVFLIADAVDGARLSPTSGPDDQVRLRRIYPVVAEFAAGCGANGLTVIP